MVLHSHISEVRLNRRPEKRSRVEALMAVHQSILLGATIALPLVAGGESPRHDGLNPGRRLR